MIEFLEANPKNSWINLRLCHPLLPCQTGKIIYYLARRANTWWEFGHCLLQSFYIPGSMRARESHASGDMLKHMTPALKPAFSWPGHLADLLKMSGQGVQQGLGLSSPAVPLLHNKHERFIVIGVENANALRRLWQKLFTFNRRTSFDRRNIMWIFWQLSIITLCNIQMQ